MESYETNEYRSLLRRDEIQADQLPRPSGVRGTDSPAKKSEEELQAPLRESAPSDMPAVEPGEGWRLLVVGDLIEEDDECSIDGKTWHENRFAAGCKIKQPSIPYRRRISPSASLPPASPKKEEGNLKH